MTSRTRRSRSARSVTPAMTSGSATMSPMRRRGLSEAIGSWKISCRRRRISRIASPPSVVSSVPSKVTLPAGRPAQLQDGAAEGGLAAARLAHQAQRLAAIDMRLTSDTANRLVPPIAYSTVRFSTESSGVSS